MIVDERCHGGSSVMRQEIQNVLWGVCCFIKNVLGPFRSAVLECGERELLVTRCSDTPKTMAQGTRTKKTSRVLKDTRWTRLRE